jgi:glycosyltransferase involved in cell wall biosynthesis
MRIGVNCYPLAPEVGGIKQYFLTLFEYLLLHDFEHEYIFFWHPQNQAELDKLSSDRWRKSAIQIQHPSDIRQHLDQFDLYFCPFGVLRPRPLPKPTVVTLPDIQEVFYPEFFSVGDRLSRDLNFPASTNMADRVITHSQSAKQSLLEHHRLPSDKVIIAYHCIDQRYYRSREIAQAPAAPIPDRFIFYPANLWPHKNHDRLLQALRILESEHNLKIPAVLTGFEQSNGYPLAQKVAEYGLDQQIFPLGYLSLENLAYLYNHAQMLVFPSLYEGFGLPLIEAMVAGCPVVAAIATAIPEIIADAGLLFDPTSPPALATAIAQVWQNQNLRQSLIQRGQRRAQAFSPAQTANIHLQTFAAAAQSYRYQRFVWNTWVYGPAHRLKTGFKWRQTLLKIVSQKLLPRRASE